MEKKINNTLFITTPEGEQLVFKVLFTYHSENFGKDYAVFYNEKDENHLIVYSFDEDHTLHEVENDEEFAELEVVLYAYDEEQAVKAMDGEEAN
ncbi:MAG: DUF1292 domain-containing protein [Clostridia bacterium]|nr:DUF1292 domain-containing protein [Clostridia bacterium]